jgi:hypothetical protein
MEMLDQVEFLMKRQMYWLISGIYSSKKFYNIVP